MKFLALILSVVLSFTAADVESDWNEFKANYGKLYGAEEEAYRKTIFVENFKKIEEHNAKYEAGIESFDMGVNEFTDLTHAEYELKLSQSSLHDDFGTEAEAQNFTPRALPNYVNWVEHGYNNAIINQGVCGSCYTFAAVAALEAQYFIKYKQLIQLSQQELLDCTKSYGNYGCRGGFQRSVYNYIMHHGVGHANSNPYRGVERNCYRGQPRIGISNFYVIPKGNEQILKQAVANVGPIPVDFDATLDTFRFYRSGIYFDSRCSTNRPSHAVAIVGYGTNNNGQDYWFVRNSWGKQWGQGGYFYMARNRYNHCGIASRSVYPIVK